MPHTNSVLIVHPNGIFYAQRARVEHLVEKKRAYWSDAAKTKLIILKSTDDEPSNGYEYGGKKSYDGEATRTHVDWRTSVLIEKPIERIDRTGIPVREPGGQQVLQLKPLEDRRTEGSHATKHDNLYRPNQRRTSAYDDLGYRKN